MKLEKLQNNKNPKNTCKAKIYPNIPKIYPKIVKYTQ